MWLDLLVASGLGLPALIYGSFLFVHYMFSHNILPFFRIYECKLFRRAAAAIYPFGLYNNLKIVHYWEYVYINIEKRLEE